MGGGFTGYTADDVTWVDAVLKAVASVIERGCESGGAEYGVRVNDDVRARPARSSTWYEASQQDGSNDASRGRTKRRSAPD
jgi:hypothetical protein